MPAVGGPAMMRRMRSRTFLASLLALSLALVASGFDGSAAGAAADRCAAKGSRTVFANEHGRIFTRGTRVDGEPAVGHYSCSFRFGKRFRLDFSDFFGEDEYGPFAIRPRYAAYAFEPGCANCDGRVALVEIQDLRTGRHRFAGRASSLGEGREDVVERVTDLELRGTGSAAWIVSIEDDGQTTLEVHKQERRRRTLLASGPDIERRSLELRGATLSWTQGSERRTARLR